MQRNFYIAKLGCSKNNMFYNICRVHIVTFSWVILQQITL